MILKIGFKRGIDRYELVNLMGIFYKNDKGGEGPFSPTPAWG